ncbi:hypothetical protein LWI28_002313 [Acer negundo]|uniref:ubiquitinyl hydrolase 1 n=1 Tax=Acer negundo TaxID=4023 RepID=A0AAD5J3L8_ACENE|nr:hypothetical protein LWI28_002313 [Acer negundo]KAK4850792.1 hypothetical protein QYF36_009859 [Acer negundo]
MLEPREADVPALFLVLVVLPLVAYILLGKWSEVAKKRERTSLLAHLAAEESIKAEALARASVIPLLSTSKSGVHVCARCFAPSKTRCSRCKSVRYCSGRCQIIHWREVHKQECQQLETTISSSSPMDASVESSVLLNESLNSQLFGYNNKQAGKEKPPSMNCHSLTSGAFPSTDCLTVDTFQMPMLERRIVDKRVSHKPNREMLTRVDTTVSDSHEEIPRTGATNSTSSNNFSTKKAFTTHKSRRSDSVESAEESLKKHNFISFRSSSGSSSSSYSAKYGTNAHDNDKMLKCKFYDEIVECNCNPERAAVNGSINAKIVPNPPGTRFSKSPKSCMRIDREQPCLKVVGEQSCPEKEMKGPIADISKVARRQDTILPNGSNGIAGMGIMKMMGLRKSTKLRPDVQEVWLDQHMKIQMLFPYEEFVKFFQCEIFDLSPRGLLNCGNSCYANAVLQCLTCTKPLIIYLLDRSHSRACCRNDWCLMCELEQHVTMLRESGGPLSPRRILLHMQGVNCQIGDGSQEDAHEFLRLLVASMQSICLEGLGGERKVDPRLQETTFIQQTFGGRLKSKVKCLSCYHESERYENIMDLTLEIFGWVESLEDALTQFTTSEDLDGENMYRCGRCATYVRARKQLSIHEAPNILTIVLKRFQEGRYGKLNKCISFPELLDMIPFMTGAGDIPPLYILYAVVVHVDTQNASFSGHYVSYVKDMQGSWFMIDDTEVHPVPMSQVMSEGAYILFYMRSCPRPQRVFTGKAMRRQVPASTRHSIPKTHKSSRQGQSNLGSNFVAPESLYGVRPEIVSSFTEQTSKGILRGRANKNIQGVIERRVEPVSVESSDAISSDWSLFTSSDEASFTTESTRDSFSTVDYADTCNVDQVSDFNTKYAPESASLETVCCRTFSNSWPQTRFISEEMKGYVMESYPSTHFQNSVQRERSLRQVSDSPTEFSSNSNCGVPVKFTSNQKYNLDRTCGIVNIS